MTAAEETVKEQVQKMNELIGSKNQKTTTVFAGTLSLIKNEKV